MEAVVEKTDDGRREREGGVKRAGRCGRWGCVAVVFGGQEVDLVAWYSGRIDVPGLGLLG